MAIVEACNLDAFERNVIWFREQEGEDLENAVRRAQAQLERDCSVAGRPVPDRILRSKKQ